MNEDKDQFNIDDEDGKDQFVRWIGGRPSRKEGKKASNKLELGLRSFFFYERKGVWNTPCI